MAKSRQLKGRIRSVQNTRKITKTMELVATSKLKRAQDRVVAARPYADALRDVIADLVTAELAAQFPLLRRPAPPSKGGPKRAAVILLTSNRGLAGGFNANLIKEARRRIESLESEGYTVDLYGVGKKGIGFFKYLGRKLATERIDVGDRPTADHAAEIVEPLVQAYAAGELGSVDLVQARFLSALSTPPQFHSHGYAVAHCSHWRTRGTFFNGVFRRRQCVPSQTGKLYGEALAAAMGCIYTFGPTFPRGKIENPPAPHRVLDDQTGNGVV